MPEALAPALPSGCTWIAAPPGVACASIPLAQVAEGVPAEGPPAQPLAALLSDEEQRRFGELRFRKRRIEWLAGRVAAKFALQRLAGAAALPREAVVRSGAEGRPALDGAQISISHSRRDAIAAVAHVPVGVDTETFDALAAVSLDALVRPAEADSLRRDLGCDRTAARTLTWCLKEALFKVVGGGAFTPFATALQVVGWEPAQERPLLRWAPEQEPAGAVRPQLAQWRARFGLGSDSAWVLVWPARAAHMD
jgi:phosphopantetheinyl transferase